MVSRRYTTVGLFLSLAAVWGLSFVASRGAVADIPPVWLAALRFDVAAVLLFGYVVLLADRWLPAGRSEWAAILSGGTLFVALHHALLFAGQQYVTSAVAAVVVSLDPILAAGFARALLPEERLSPAGGLGLLLGLCGVAIIADPSPVALGGSRSWGVLLVFLAAAAFALGAVLTRRFRTGLPVAALQAWMMLVGAVLLHVTILVGPVASFATITWSERAVAGLAYLAVVAAGVGYLLYFELLARVGPIEVNLVAYLSPVAAAVGGWLLLGEALAPRTIAGFALIILGFVVLKRNALRKELRLMRAALR